MFNKVEIACIAIRMNGATIVIAQTYQMCVLDTIWNVSRMLVNNMIQYQLRYFRKVGLTR